MKILKTSLVVLLVLAVLMSISLPVFATVGGTADNGTSTSQTDGTPTDEEQKKPSALSSALSMGLPILLLIAFFYFGMYRPQKKQEKEAKEMRDSMRVGSKVTTHGGIIGRIVILRDDELLIESGNDRTRFLVAKWAVRSVENSETQE